MKFLMGMNESFGQVRTQVLLMDPWPSLNKVYSLLIQEEMKRNVGNKTHSRVESTALAAKGQNFTVNSNFGHGSKAVAMPLGGLGAPGNTCLEKNKKIIYNSLNFFYLFTLKKMRTPLRKIRNTLKIFMPNKF